MKTNYNKYDETTIQAINEILTEIYIELKREENILSVY